ncbi:MAG: aldo/keto reductase [Sphaerochaetaceae bacterium]
MKRKSDLALGSWQFGPSHGFWTGQTTQESLFTIRTALKVGLFHFDTAPAYGNGLAEQLLGSVLSQAANRESILIDTKFMPKQPNLIERDVQKSLNRLKSPYIDTLYLHWPNSKLDMRPILQSAVQLIEQGTVRHLGLSNTPLSLLDTLLQEFPIEFLQIPCSLVWTRGLEDYKQYAQEQNISLVGYSPLGLGLLSGRYRKKPEDSRGNLYVFKDTAITIYHELLALLASLAEKKPCSMAQIALAWARSQDFATILVGARNPEQLKALMETDTINLDEEEKRGLDEMAERLNACAPQSWDNLFGHRW